MRNIHSLRYSNLVHTADEASAAFMGQLQEEAMA